jgi:hypothetical protein
MIGTSMDLCHFEKPADPRLEQERTKEFRKQLREGIASEERFVAEAN